MVIVLSLLPPLVFRVVQQPLAEVMVIRITMIVGTVRIHNATIFPPTLD